MQVRRWINIFHLIEKEGSLNFVFGPFLDQRIIGVPVVYGPFADLRMMGIDFFHLIGDGLFVDHEDTSSTFNFMTSQSFHSQKVGLFTW